MNLKESWGLYVGGLGGAKKKERNVIIVPKKKKGILQGAIFPFFYVRE